MSAKFRERFDHVSVTFRYDNGRPYADIKRVGKKDMVSLYVHEPFQYYEDEEGAKMLSAAQLFEREFEHWTRTNDQMASGKPIDALPGLTVGRIAELRSHGIRSVEQLASLRDGDVKRIGFDGASLRDQAQAYLMDNRASAEDGRLRAENDALRERLEALERMMDGQSDEGSDDDEEEPAGAARFADWDVEALRAYITDQTGEAPHKNVGANGLRRKAAQVAARLSK